MNIILTNAPVKNGNRGCVALSLSAMYIIDKILNDRNIPHQFYLPQSGYEKIAEHTIKAGDVILKFMSLMDITPLSIKHQLKKMFKHKEYQTTKKAYQKADFILDIGQGDSFADIYGKRRFDWIFSQYRLGMKYKKPYCILPQTIGPFKEASIRAQACKGINYAKCVLVRDKQSRDYVKELLPDKPVTEIIDVAFFMPFKRKEFNKDFVHVGLNVSALLWHGGYTRDNQFGLKVDYPSLVRSIMDYFLEQANVKVHLIPHVVGGERHIENDYAVSYDLFEEYNHPNLILSPLFLDPIVAKSYIAGMDFFMGARMHSTIAAFSSEVPVFPMAYSRKFNGLFTDTLQYPYMADMKAQSETEILAGIKQYYEQRERLKELEHNRMQTTVEERRKLMEEKLCEFFGIK
ncbi:polysaccharide pyruvyl transferase family protein [uncultured Phocaeicola sp.]|uniref:polysaccharide pyruvyl transferase family protein n=1 Tax=uncultured Phocaeicola sp. TaxID=990718 RepID=UPI003459616A